VALAIAVTLLALGDETFQDWAAVRDGFRPKGPQAAEREIARIAAMREDPETANMFFLSRFLVMVVQEAVGQMLAGLLAAWSFTEDVSDKIVEAPFAVASLWLALVCLVTYRRIGGFARWSERLRARGAGR
jgi:hypothetical protein